MGFRVVNANIHDRLDWDEYTLAHPQSTLYHLFGWRAVIEKTYGHKSYYLMAIQEGLPENDRENSRKRVLGILPLVRLKHFIFGNNLISIPYFDMCGILADDQLVEKALLTEAIKVGRELKTDTVEFRHLYPIHSDNALNIQLRSHKIRMLLRLPDSSQELMGSFKSKLRSQVKKPIREGLFSRIGGAELLHDFYDIFSVNMRDLGSPVHSKKMMLNLLETFPEQTKIVIVYDNNKPIAAGMIIGYKDVLENPWASALRQYSRKSPNMLLYWTMLEYACDHGYRFFNFGRSTPDEGTYKFKEQWGAEPQRLYWYNVYFDTRDVNAGADDKSRFGKVIQYWQKLPVFFTKVVGPLIRKHIGL